MAEGGAAARRTTGLRVLTVVLALLTLALVAALVTVLRLPPATDGDDAKAAVLSEEHDAVTKAARTEALAFLTVDHRDMDPLVTRVLAGATGSFRAQYARGARDLVASARRTRAVSTGKVRAVGVDELGRDRAVVLVAADTRVRNTSTRGKTQPRFYRLELTMVRRGQAWLASGLELVD